MTEPKDSVTLKFSVLLDCSCLAQYREGRFRAWVGTRVFRLAMGFPRNLFGIGVARPLFLHLISIVPRFIPDEARFIAAGKV
jgi:hypothetical protein